MHIVRVETEAGIEYGQSSDLPEVAHKTHWVADSGSCLSIALTRNDLHDPSRAEEIPDAEFVTVWCRDVPVPYRLLPTWFRKEAARYREDPALAVCEEWWAYMDDLGWFGTPSPLGRRLNFRFLRTEDLSIPVYDAGGRDEYDEAWRVYDPAWLVELAQAQLPRPEWRWLDRALARNRLCRWRGRTYVDFDCQRALAPEQSARYVGSELLIDPREGWLDLDVTEDRRVGAIFFRDHR